MKYKNNKNWNLFLEDNKLFISKGADEIYFLDEVNEEQAKLIYDAYINNSIDDLIKNNTVIEIINKLEKAGVIFKSKSISNKKLKLCIKYYGNPTTELRDEITKNILKRKNIKIIDDIKDSDLSLLIRINTSLKSILEDYSLISYPHLFIDLGYANNISIGPIVFDDSACLGCYIGRIVNNWGDALPPEEPLVTKKIELISSFILDRIDQYILYGNCPDIINNIWNYNTNNYSSTYNKVYKLPWCPYCGNSHDNPKIELPWEREFNNE